MYPGYMTVDGVEILNSNRTKAYANRFMPGLEVKCDAPGLHLALMQSPYTTPAMDNAPWYRVTRPATGRFLGIHSIDIDGLDDSTETVSVHELLGSGGIHTTPRHRSKEMRVVAVAMALDDEAMDEGMSWLRSVLSNEGCSDTQLGCTGRKVRMFSAGPTTSADATQLGRNFYGVEQLEAPTVIQKMRRPTGEPLWKIEFTLNAGRPWAWTDNTTVANLNMDTAVNFTEAAVDCFALDDPYAGFIDDPFYTAISKPPQPPLIKPPNILDLTSWRRISVGIPTMLVERAGRAVPIITVAAPVGTALQHVRLRFYEDPDVEGCDYKGEFLVSYLPAGSVMSIDGTTETITVTRADGSVVPGGHLVFGSDGRPLMWPSLGCNRPYTMMADMMPGQTGVIVLLDVAVRT